MPHRTTASTHSSSIHPLTAFLFPALDPRVLPGTSYFPTSSHDAKLTYTKHLAPPALMTATSQFQKLPLPCRAMSARCANTSVCCVETSAILTFSKSAMGDSPVETLRDLLNHQQRLPSPHPISARCISFSNLPPPSRLPLRAPPKTD